MVIGGCARTRRARRFARKVSARDAQTMRDGDLARLDGVARGRTLNDGR
jgi:hypothetical protein